jgi:hypothetical protein
MRKEGGVSYFKLLAQRSREGTKENYEKLNQGNREPTIKLGTSRI